MSLYRCSDEDRIDLIVLKHYGTLEPLKQVLEANVQLSQKSMILKAGDIIELPEIDFKDFSSNSEDDLEVKEEELLW